MPVPPNDKVEQTDITDIKLDSLLDKIAEDVSKSIQHQLDDEELSAVHDLICYQPSTGGKRLRPALAVLMGQALGGDYEQIIELATTAELLHNSCVTADTRVLKADGTAVCITDIKPGDEVLSVDLSTGSPVKRTVTHLFDNGIKPTFTLKLRNRSIRCTANHQFLSLRRAKIDFYNIEPSLMEAITTTGISPQQLVGELNEKEHQVYHWLNNIPISETNIARLEKILNITFKKYKTRSARFEYSMRWLPLSEIRPGDYLVIQKNMPEDDDVRATPLHSISIDPAKLCQTLGLFIGDGNYRKNAVSFSLDKETADAYLPILTEVFGKPPYFNKANGFQYTFFSKYHVDLLKSLSIKTGSHDKYIPPWIYRLPRALKCAFLRGIIDSDGHIATDNGNCHIGFANQTLCEDLKSLLDSIGFTTSKIHTHTCSNEHFKNCKTKETTSFRIVISNPSKILKEIGSNRPSNITKLSRNNRCAYTFEEHVRSPLKANLPNRETFALNKVHCIEPSTEQRVYDIRVDDSHNFIANNIVVHNSLVMDDVLDGDLVRRGKPTAHALFGAGTAMMGGNILALLAFKLGGRRGFPILNSLVGTASNLALGSTEEFLFHEYNEERYLRIIGLKTASLFKAPCEIGAVVAGAARPEYEIAMKYGWSAGMLYQLTDDLVDILKTHNTGEPAGHMKNGTPTLAFIHAYTQLNSRPPVMRARGDTDMLALLDKFLKSPPLTRQEFEMVYEALLELGSIDYTNSRIEDYNKACHTCCTQLPVSRSRDYLAAMPRYMYRKQMAEAGNPIV